MADFYATNSAASASGDTVTALQGTVPWIVAGGGTAGVSGTAVLTVQGIAGGTALPVSGSITATNPSVSATGAAVPAEATMVGGTDGTNLRALKVDTGGELQVDVVASALPSGAATEVTLAAILADTATIDAKTPALGQAAMAASVPVVIASDQSAVPVSGTVAISGTVAATQSGTWTVQPGNTANTIAWKVDGSAVTQPVSGSVMVSGTVTANAGTGTFTIAFGALTGSYATVITAGGDLKNVSMRNNTNAIVVVSLNSGAGDSYTLDSGDMVSLDLKPLGLRVASGATLQAKYSGGAPTSGSIRINGVY